MSAFPFVVQNLLTPKNPADDKEKYIFLGNLLYKLNFSKEKSIQTPQDMLLKYYPFLKSHDIEEIIKSFISQLPNHISYLFLHQL